MGALYDQYHGRGKYAANDSSAVALPQHAPFQPAPPKSTPAIERARRCWIGKRNPEAEAAKAAAEAAAAEAAKREWCASPRGIGYVRECDGITEWAFNPFGGA